MYLTGFTDEAGADLSTQIKATQELGWQYLSARMVNESNIHDLSDGEFKKAVEQLSDANIKIAEFGSLIGSWAKTIHSDFSLTLEEIDRAIPRMQLLGTKIVRIMSYAQEPWGKDQHEEERFRRLRIIADRFASHGLIAAHENCMNWGGFSYKHTLRLLEEIPGTKLIFDTGNPVFQRDRSKDELPPWQNSLEFYNKVKDHIVHVHIKDAVMPDNSDEPRYTQAGKGDGNVREILTDLISSGYEGGLAIEPHIAKVFHDASQDKSDPNVIYQSYIDYGKNVEALIKDLRAQTGKKAAE